MIDLIGVITFLGKSSWFLLLDHLKATLRSNAWVSRVAFLCLGDKEVVYKNEDNLSKDVIKPATEDSGLLWWWIMNLLQMEMR